MLDGRGKMLTCHREGSGDSDPLLFSGEDAVDDTVWVVARADRNLM